MTKQEIMAFARSEFEWLHAHPELAYEEFETTARLRADFVRAGIRMRDLPLATGLVAEIGTGEKPIIALRTDIDALPIHEETELPYRSQTDGKMHACGHDFHMASVLAAALMLKEQEAALAGTVYIVCQPAEEAPGGARCILETGALQEVSAIFGLHARPIYPVGTLGLCAGGMMASVDKFEIIFHGVGTHAAQPDRGKHPAPIRHSTPEPLEDRLLEPQGPVRADHAAVIPDGHKSSLPERHPVQLPDAGRFFYQLEVRHASCQVGQLSCGQEGIVLARILRVHRRLRLVLRQVVKFVLRSVSALQSFQLVVLRRRGDDGRERQLPILRVQGVQRIHSRALLHRHIERPGPLYHVADVVLAADLPVPAVEHVARLLSHPVPPSFSLPPFPG